MWLKVLITAWVAITSCFQGKGNISWVPRASEREKRRMEITTGQSRGKASKGKITW